MIRGEAGIGKSALLRYAAERSHGMQPLEIRALEVESHVAFAGLAALLAPVLDLLPALPEPQAAALRGALALGPPLVGDRFAVYVGTLGLLAGAAGKRPLFVSVDDAHWLDAPSAEALLFAARRLDAEPVGLLAATRDDAERPFEAAGVEELLLKGLSVEAAKALIGERLGRAPPEDVTRRLWTGTGGNPLALVETLAQLDAEHLAGLRPLPDPLPLAGGIEQAFQRRVDRLPEPCRRALLVAAASDTPEIGPVAHACRRGGMSIDALTDAEEAGLVELGAGRIEFRHPLLRAAVYRAAGPAERRRAHAALADALDDPGRRAGHLAAAALAPDERVAAEIDAAAQSARERSGYAVAASGFEAAARLTPDPAVRAGRLLAAASAAMMAGTPRRTVVLLDDVGPADGDPLLRADVTRLRALLAQMAGDPGAAHDQLVAGAAAVEHLDPGRALAMLTEAAMPCFQAGWLERARTTAERARALAERVGAEDDPRMLLVLGAALVITGSTQEGAAAAEHARRLVSEPELLASPLVLAGLHVLTWLERYDEERELLNRAVSTGRTVGALAGLPLALGYLCELEYRVGDWDAAYAAGSESLALADETGQAGHVTVPLTVLARIDAARGQAATCRERVERARALTRASGGDSIYVYCDAALGLLHLGAGEPKRAVPLLQRAAATAEGFGLRHPNVVEHEPDLVEACVRTGRRADARRTLSAFEAKAGNAGLPWALATAARCRGLLAADDDAGEHYADALRWHERSPTPFDRARTELCFGEHLRRTRRRSDASDRLRSALVMFERLGAAPWAEHARAELEANGERVERAESVPAWEQLTPQELQVALAVSRGATNREAAAALFLSPKTIESHLSRIYRKLGIRSRTELSRRLAGGVDPSPGPRPPPP